MNFKLFLIFFAFSFLIISCKKEEPQAPEQEQEQEQTCDAANIATDIVGTWTSADWSGSVKFGDANYSEFDDPEHLMGYRGGQNYLHDTKFYAVTSSSITIEFRKCYGCDNDSYQIKYNIVKYDCNSITLQDSEGLGDEFTITK